MPPVTKNAGQSETAATKPARAPRKVRGPRNGASTAVIVRKQVGLLLVDHFDKAGASNVINSLQALTNALNEFDAGPATPVAQ